MKYFLLAWLISGIISYIYGVTKHGDDTGTILFPIYIIIIGPIGLLIQILEEFN